MHQKHFPEKRIALAKALRAFRNSTKKQWLENEKIDFYEAFSKGNREDSAYVQSKALIAGLVESGLLGKPSKSKIEDLTCTIFQMVRPTVRNFYGD